MVCYIYKERVPNISDRVYIEVDFKSTDTDTWWLSVSAQIQSSDQEAPT